MPLYNLLAVINEVDNFPIWVPFCNGGKELSRTGRASCAAHVKIWIPPPCADREGFFAGYAMIRKNKSILIITRSYDEDELY